MSLTHSWLNLKQATEKFFLEKEIIFQEKLTKLQEMLKMDSKVFEHLPLRNLVDDELKVGKACEKFSFL